MTRNVTVVQATLSGTGRQSQKGQALAGTSPKLTVPPKLCFNILTDKLLRDSLRKFKLPVTGKREVGHTHSRTFDINRRSVASARHRMVQELWSASYFVLSSTMIAKSVWYS